MMAHTRQQCLVGGAAPIGTPPDGAISSPVICYSVKLWTLPFQIDPMGPDGAIVGLGHFCVVCGRISVFAHLLYVRPLFSI